MKNYIKILIIFLSLSLIISSPIVIASNSLKGKVIVIDSGHGGKDPGSVYKDIYEKDINLAISKYLKKNYKKRVLKL